MITASDVLWLAVVMCGTYAAAALASEAVDLLRRWWP